MTLATNDIARSFGLTETELMEQALRRFLLEKRREILQERLGILVRYQVETIQQLEERIATGEAIEHPLSLIHISEPTRPY